MLEIRLLGQFELRWEGQPVGLASRPAQSLLAYLLLARGAAHRRERLAGLLWPEATEANARGYLRQALWRIRRALAPAGREYLLSDDLTIQFDPQAPYRLDTAELEATADNSVEALRQRVSAYRGELLPGFYHDWVAAERERLQAVFEGQIGQLLERLAAERRWPEVVEWAERWLTLSAAPEPAYRALMRAHAGLGNRAQVAAAYERCVQALAGELAVEPSAQTRAAYAAAQQAAGAQAAWPAPQPASNLPAESTPIVGREQELAEIAERMAPAAACRLLTLIGPGGIGKTRLALAAAARMQGAHADGVWFVPLALIPGVEFVGAAVAEALSLSLYGGQPAVAQLLNHVRGRQCLLVLDGFEHLLEGAALLNSLLAGAPGVKLLVTSQERLNLSGEWLLEVGGLAVPDAGTPDTAGYSAVQLFIQSARRVKAGFAEQADAGQQAAIIRICQLVGGMPLGLELAAAWLRALTVEEIAEAIARETDFLSTAARDVPARQRSLQAVFDYSWNRLAADEQVVYRRLAVLRGSFGREAAEQTAGASLAQLAALVDKSLLRRTAAGRYELHGLLRRYGQAQLAQAGETLPACERHLDFFRQLAETAEPGLRRGDQLEWLAGLEAEYENLRAALEWSAGEGSALAGLRLAGALARFWYLRGYWQEGRHWLEKLLGRAGDAIGQAEQLARAKALAGLGWLANEDSAEAAAYTESLALCRAAGEAWGTAYALRGLGARAWNLGEAVAAEDLLAESLVLFQQAEPANEPWGQALVRLNQGWLAHDRDDLERAGALWEAGRALFAQTGDRWGLAVALGNQGYLARLRLDDAGAAAASEASLALFQALGDKAGTATSLVRLGQVALRQAHFEQARRLFEQTLALQRELEYGWEGVASLGELGLIAAIQGDYARARTIFSEGLNLELAANDYSPLADVLHNQGQAAYYEGDLGLAEAAWQESARRYHALEDALSAALPQVGLGLVAWRRGEPAQASALLTEALATIRAGGDLRDIAHAALALGRVRLSQGDEAEAEALFAEGLRLCQQTGDKHGLTEALECEAALYAQRGEAQAAAQRLDEARALREALGAPVPAVEGR